MPESDSKKMGLNEVNVYWKQPRVISDILYLLFGKPVSKPALTYTKKEEDE
jgi:hypothetical protein